MSTGMWFKDDIRGVLLGNAVATEYMGSERAPAEAEAFRAGWLAALAAVALSLGVADLPEQKLRTAAQLHRTYLEER